MKNFLINPTVVVLAATCLALATPLNTGRAGVVYDSGGFESPRFNTGVNLAGQDPIVPPAGYGPWHQDTGTSTAVVQTDIPNGGLQSVKITRAPGASGDTRWGITVPITPTEASNVVAIDFDLHAIINPGTNWGGPDLGPLFGVECYDSSSGTPKLIGSLFLDAYAGDIVYQQATNGTLQATSTFIPRNEYHHYTLTANFASKTYSIYVDGNWVHTEGFVDPTASAFTDAPLTTLAATTNFLDQAVGTAYFDNYTISATTSRLNYLVWRGDGLNNTWDIGASSNWFNGDGLDVFSNSIPVVFDDTGSNSPAIYLQGTLQPASITINASQSYTFAGTGALGGSASLLKRGSGTLTLAGNNTYTGATTVSNGTLNITGNNSGSGPVFINSGATLSGSGTLAGPVTIISGGTLSPGNPVGTLTLNGDLTLSGDTSLQFELGASSDHLAIGGNLNLSGALNIADSGGFAPGTYNLISYGGALSGPGLLIASAPSGYNYSLDTNTAGQINLLVTVPPPPPDAPGGLTATPVSDSQINLAWIDNSTNESNFLIERSVNNSVFTQIAAVGTDVTSFSDTNLPSGTTFYYRVRASNSGGYSSYSDVANARTLGVPPPTGLAATPGNGQVALNWNASDGATSYNVKRSLTNGGPYTVIANPSTTNYTDTAVTNGTRYYYVVSALNANGESSDSLQISAIPDIELQLELKFDETSGTNAADSSGHDRDGTLVNSATFVSGIISNAIDFNGTNGYVSLPQGMLTNLSDFTIATWVNPDSISMWSRIFDFGSGPTTNMFLTPRSGDGTVRFAITIGGGNNEQRIDGNAPLPAGTWTHVAVTFSGTLGTLYVNGSPVGTNSMMVLSPSTLGATTQNWIGRSQYSGDPYLNGRVDEFRIYNRALAPSEISSLFTNVPPPSAPAELAADAENARVALSWTASPGGMSYNVKRSTSSGGPYSTIASDVAITNYTDTNVINNTIYYYVISAVNSGGEGANSVQVSATPTRGHAIARYEFEGNANDTSGNGYNGTATSVTYGPGKIGTQAAEFDGTASFVQIPDMIGTNFTVAMWVKTIDTNSTGSAWYNGKGLLDGKATVSAANATLQPVADTFIQETASTTNHATDTLQAMSGGGQQNVAYVRFDLSGFSSVAPGATLTLFNTTTSMTWSSTQVEIYGLLNLSGNTPQDWDESTLTYSTVGAEVPGDNNPATQDLNTSRVIFLGNLPPLLDTAASVPLAFSSTNLDAFLASRMADNKLVTFLIVNRNGSARNLIFQSRETGAGTPYTGPSLAISGMPAQNDWGAALLNSKFAIGVGNPDTTISSLASVNDGAWHHIAASRDSLSGAVRIYVDGVLDTAGVAPAGVRNSASMLRIGALQNNSGFFNGTIDEVRIYNRVLDDSEITALAGRAAQFGNLQLTGADAVVSGENGPPGGTYYVLTTTNISLPVAQWSASQTNQFDDAGNFSFTNSTSASPRKFFMLQLP
jgi:autotransporter-associated beta strand protein